MSRLYWPPPMMSSVSELERNERVRAPDLLAQAVDLEVELPGVLRAPALGLDGEVLEEAGELRVHVGQGPGRRIAAGGVDQALAERVQVRGRRRPAALAHLGRAVALVQRLEALAGARRVHDRPAPVDDPQHVIVGPDEDVRRVEVAVQDAVLVRPAER